MTETPQQGIDKAPEPSTTTPVTQPAPTFSLGFAIVGAVVGLLLTGWTLIISGLLADHLGLTADDWQKLGAAGRLAARMTLPTTLLGVCIVVIGLWMAVVEWRGTFAKAERGVTSKGPVDASAIIDAVGKLRGAALVMVVGALLLLGSVYVAGSFAAPPGPAAGSQPSSGN